MRFLTLLAFLLPGFTHGAIIISDIQGASNLENFFAGSPTNNNNIQVYGGLSGECVDPKNGQVATCDTCATADYGVPCNTRQVFGTGLLQFTYQSDSTAGKPVVRCVDVNNQDSNPLNQENQAFDTAANNTLVATVPWDQICACIFTDATNTVTTCDDTVVIKPSAGTAPVIGNRTFKISVEGAETDTLNIEIFIENTMDFNEYNTSNFDESHSSSTDSAIPGLAEFAIFPGDSKVFLLNPLLRSTSSGFAIRKVHIYATEDASSGIGSFANLTGSSIAELDVFNGTIDQDTIESGGVLVNDTTYVFAAAVESLAGNVGFYTENGDSTPPTDHDVCPTGVDGTLFSNRCHTATPSEVAGLFADETNCFIATAAMGSSFDPHVTILRQFRSQYLLKTTIGKKLVRWYYQTSPTYARWISEKPWRQKTARFLLLPAFTIGYAVVYWPLSLALLFLFLFVLRSRSYRQSHGRA